jgi:hypothetical protein
MTEENTVDPGSEDPTQHIAENTSADEGGETQTLHCI